MKRARLAQSPGTSRPRGPGGAAGCSPDRPAGVPPKSPPRRPRHLTFRSLAHTYSIVGLGLRDRRPRRRGAVQVPQRRRHRALGPGRRRRRGHAESQQHGLRRARAGAAGRRRHRGAGACGRSCGPTPCCRTARWGSWTRKGNAASFSGKTHLRLERRPGRGAERQGQHRRREGRGAGGPRLQRSGQHHGLRSDGEEPRGDVRADHGRPGRSAGRGAQGGSGGRRRQAGHAVGRAAGGAQERRLPRAPTTASSTSGSTTRRIRSPSWSGCSRCTSCTSFPASRRTWCPITPAIVAQLEPILLAEPAGQPQKWLTGEAGLRPTRQFLEALKNFMYWENYDVRVRMDGKIDRVVLDDILNKRRAKAVALTSSPPPQDEVLLATAAARVAAPAQPPRDTRFFGHPKRPLHALLHRDVGALQLLRDAGAAHPVHDRAARRRRARASTPRRPAPSTGPTSRWSTSPRFRADGSPTGSWASGGRRSTAACSSCWATSASRSPRMTIVLHRPRPGDAGHRPAQAQHQHHGGRAVHAGTTSGATPASRSTTWGSTPAPSSRRWSAAGSPRASSSAASSARMGLAPESAWHWGFGMAAVGMFLGLVQYLAGWKHLGDAGMYPAAAGVAREAARRPAAAAAARASAARSAAPRCSGCSRATGRGHHHGAGREQRARRGAAAHHGGVLRLDVHRRQVDAGGAEAAGRGAGAVRRGDDLLVGVRAGRLHPQPVRPAGHPHRGVRASRSRRAGSSRSRRSRSWCSRRCSPGSGGSWARGIPRSPTKFTIGLVFVALSFAILVIPAAGWRSRGSG